MIKHLSLAVISLLFVALVSGCGDSEPSNTGDGQTTQKEATSSAKQAPGVDKETEKQMRKLLFDVNMWTDALITDENIQQKELDSVDLTDIYNYMTSEAKSSFTKATKEDGIKVENILTIAERDTIAEHDTILSFLAPGDKYFVVTIFSPDGKYKIVHDKLKTNSLDLDKAKLEKVE